MANHFASNSSLVVQRSVLGFLFLSLRVHLQGQAHPVLTCSRWSRPSMVSGATCASGWKPGNGGRELATIREEMASGKGQGKGKRTQERGWRCTSAAANATQRRRACPAGGALPPRSTMPFNSTCLVTPWSDHGGTRAKARGALPSHIAGRLPSKTWSFPLFVGFQTQCLGIF